MRTLVKYLFAAVLIALPIYGIYALFNWLVSSARVNPIPTDPTVTVTDFVTCLQEMPDQDYFRCRELLAMQIKTPMLINQSSVEDFNHHFERIRNYLLERVGADFVSTMQTSQEGLYTRATFNGDIVLNFELSAARGSDDQNHFTIRNIREFPLDIMPGLGLEMRNRSLDYLMDSDTGSSQQYVEIDNAADVVPPRPGESPSQRLSRLINSYFSAPQLDTRHTILDAILADFPDDPKTHSLLQQIAADQDEAVHLRQYAQKILK